jgi:chloride channel 7
VFLAAYPVAYFVQAAGGSGVPEVMAYLNGINVPRVFDLRTFIVKFVSTMCAVASGLPVGPEGPMIHLGATIAAGLSQGDTGALGFTTPRWITDGAVSFRRFRNDKDKRDFVTAGAACGVATAFGAPIGGLLFAYEEVASHWSPALAVLTFFACMTALFTDKFLESAQHAIAASTGSFGTVTPDMSTVFQVNRNVSTHLLSVFPAALVGLLCGAFAAGFTHVNLRIIKLRKKYVGDDKVRKVLEPVFLVILFSLITVVVPMWFPCTSSGCVDTRGAGAGYPPGPPSPAPPPPGFFDESPATDVFCDGGSDHLHQIVEKSIMTYTCTSHWDPNDVNGTNADGKDYNELATLLHVSGEDAIKHLLTRGTHREFGYGPLIVFLLLYATFATLVAGSSLSSGLFVPMLVMGSALGRLVGLMLYDVAVGLGYSEANLASGGLSTAWVDPGVFALLGAGAFMGGVTRLTVSLAVIVMEMSGEIHFLLPILLGITVAKWTADALAPPLYHALLHVMHAPFLPDDPPGAPGLHLHDVSQIMKKLPLTTLRERETVSAIRHAMKHTTHQGFPVVRRADGAPYDVLAGSVSREHLRALLREIAGNGASRNRGSLDDDGVDAGTRAEAIAHRGDALKRRVAYEELDRMVLTPAERLSRGFENSATANGASPGVEMSTLRALDRGPRVSTGHDGGEGTSDLDLDAMGFVDLRPYMNRSAARVPDTYSVARVYDMFRTLGLRHLMVVDDCNRVVGVVTRKELLDDWLEERLDHKGHNSAGFREQALDLDRVNGAHAL